MARSAASLPSSGEQRARHALENLQIVGPPRQHALAVEDDRRVVVRLHRRADRGALEFFLTRGVRVFLEVLFDGAEVLGGAAAGFGKRAFEVLLLLRIASAPRRPRTAQRGCQRAFMAWLARMLSAISAALARAVCM